jgi:ABC-type branched-subunit amino acid transport system substrate-binding protein
MTSRLPWDMSQEEFDQCLSKLTNQPKRVLRQVLEGKSDQEISEEIAKGKSDQEISVNKKSQYEITVRSHIAFIYSAFKFPSEKSIRTRNELIRLFCKFKRDWVAHRLRDQHDRLRADDYLDIDNIRSDDSNFRLKEGIESLYREEYQRAIRIFEKEIAHDPTNPIPKILLNNAKAYQPKDRPRPFRIAVVVSYSPQNNSHVDATENVLRGVADAQTQFNESGGKDGRHLEIIIADDCNQPEVAREQARNLSDVEGILAVFGHHSSEGTEAALQIYTERSMALITPTSTSSNLCANNFFRTIGSTKIVARKYIQYIREYLKIDKIAIFYHENNEYSQTLKDDFEAAFNNQNEQIIGLIDMRESFLNIEGTIAEVIRRGCQTALVISSIETNKIALDIVRANSRRTSQKLKLVFSTSFPERLILERIPEGEEFFESVAFIRPDLTKESKYIAQAKNEWQQEEINWRVGTSYAAMQALVEAIKSSESTTTTREKILNNLKAISIDQAKFGLNWSDSDNPSNAQREYCITQIHNGKFEEIF